MKKINRYPITVMISLMITPLFVSWGVYGHEHINRAAVFCLPGPLRVFFYNHIDFITQESTVPDLRKYTLNDRSEFPRHFIDLESFGNRDSLPQTLEEAQRKYDEKFLSTNGILPWYLETMMQKLTKAFKEKRKTEIIFLAADLGHYIGDAHMPLHSSVNHDGQLSDQKGIHAFWESQLPELFGKNYNLKCSNAEYIIDVRKAIWAIIFSSHQLADTLLFVDQTLKKDLRLNEIYKVDVNGEILKNKFNQPVHSIAYATKYHIALKGMVEKQMRKAILSTASFWNTAWINAGKPDLSELDSKDLTQENQNRFKKELKHFEEGKLPGLESESEF